MTDIIVIGGGSNSLVTACYLAKAGLSVSVIEKNGKAGGGVVSVETAPGFIGDTHAMGLMTCLANPALKDNELELETRFGLQWAFTEAPFASIFDDGQGLISYTDLDKTCAEIAKFSAKDVVAYRKVVEEANVLLPLLTRAFYAPPMPDAGFTKLLMSSKEGRILANDMHGSVMEFLNARFENPIVKMHFAKWCSELMTGPDAPGTGLALYLLLGLSHKYRMGTVIGGSQNLSNALVRCLEAHGGTIQFNRTVARTVVTAGRCVGVELDDGEVLRASKAVVANIHPWRLAEMVAEVDSGIASRARATRLSEYGALNQQIALNTKPRWKAGDRYDVATLTECLKNDWEGFTSAFEAFRKGDILLDHLGPLAAAQSNVDPTRAPEGQAALYLYGFVPLEIRGGWSARKQEVADAIWDWYKGFTTNIDDTNIIARLVECPADHHRWSPNMMKGDIMGIAMTDGQLLGARPTPELSGYSIPGIEGLYLAGPFTHPGGTVTLGGRATAIRMYDDFGIPLGRGFSSW
ncbi:NAD(P)/FAD-dependent oxidoreductase [Parasphingorhabdus sp.]|uniref:phytoene desaturase family protein n=1 Tax=Parasphingorhabdus sp. TaxID=2709688 RepID=UPI0032EDA909